MQHGPVLRGVDLPLRRLARLRCGVGSVQLLTAPPRALRSNRLQPLSLSRGGGLLPQNRLRLERRRFLQVPEKAL